MSKKNCVFPGKLDCLTQNSPRFQRATEIFEEIARDSVKNNLLKFGVRGLLLNAGICQLCKGDVVAINNALERYQVDTLFLLCLQDFNLET